MGFRTDQIHAGVTPDPLTGAILTPIHQSTTFAQPSVDDYMATGYSYSRSANPTVSALQERIAVLEGGRSSWAFATGMAATTGLFMALLNGGDHAVISDVAYGGTYRVATKVFARFGVDFTFADTSDLDAVAAAVNDRTRLIFTETPANPTLKYTDIAGVSEIAAARGVPHAVDNTFLTPYFQRPLELGADLVVHSTTKYFDGHNATVGGAVVCRDEAHSEAVGFVHNAAGLIMSPMVAWLTLQGAKTLSERMDRQSANALAVARFPGGAPANLDRGLPRAGFLPAALSGGRSGLRLRGDGLVRGGRRRRGGQDADAVPAGMDPGREPRIGGVAHHPSGHHDPRGRGGGGAPPGGNHRRSGPYLGGDGERRRPDRRSRPRSGLALRSPRYRPVA